MKRTPDSTGAARPDYAYQLDQAVTLSREGGSWKVDTISSLTSPNDQPETAVPSAGTVSSWSDPATAARIDQAVEHGIPRDSKKVPDALVGTSAAATTSPLAAATTTVNLAGVVKYASMYWQQWNTYYKGLPSDDCTDFASQALFAGGWTMVHTGNYNQPDQWWYSDGGGVAPAQQSYPWENAQMLSDFGVHYSPRFYADVSTPKWKAGDIAFWIWNGDTTAKYDHTTIVTYVDASGSPYFTQHSDNHYNQAYSAYIVANPHAYVADMHLHTSY
jgi:hypothetical protein